MIRDAAAYAGKRVLFGVTRRLTPTIVSGRGATPHVALTFDDGPHPEITPALLDVLAGHRARATFFLLGSRAERWPELVAQIAEAGHAIGSHGHDHRGDWWRSPGTLGEDIERAERAIGHHLAQPKLFRPPFGALSPSWAVASWKRGYTWVHWSVDSHDWKDFDAGRVAERVTRGVHPGAVVLFHECFYRTGEGYQHTVEAVDRCLSSLSSGGVHSVSIVDFLEGR